jgi:hypothetical protein
MYQSNYNRYIYPVPALKFAIKNNDDKLLKSFGITYIFTDLDNKKILCLMIDSDKINKDSKDIPFIRSLFKIGIFYEYQLFKLDNLKFKHNQLTISSFFFVQIKISISFKIKTLNHDE